MNYNVAGGWPWLCIHTCARCDFVLFFFNNSLLLVFQIRRRRPTPATLFKVADQTSPEDDISSHQVPQCHLSAESSLEQIILCLLHGQ